VSGSGFGLDLTVSLPVTALRRGRQQPRRDRYWCRDRHLDCDERARGENHGAACSNCLCGDVIVASATSPASADPITIISGSVFIPAAGPSRGDVNIVGTRGFSLIGGVAPGAAPNGGGSGLFAQCFDPECPPGTRIDFDMGFTGGDTFSGEMTIEGARYGIGSETSMANVFLQFDG
jgi:hypothetical protein